MHYRFFYNYIAFRPMWMKYEGDEDERLCIVENIKESEKMNCDLLVAMTLKGYRNFATSKIRSMRLLTTMEYIWNYFSIRKLWHDSYNGRGNRDFGGATRA